MKKDPLVYIDDIRDSIEAIKRYTAGLAKEDFSAPLKNRMQSISGLKVQNWVGRQSF